MVCRGIQRWGGYLCVSPLYLSVRPRWISPGPVLGRRSICHTTLPTPNPCRGVQQSSKMNSPLFGYFTSFPPSLHLTFFPCFFFFVLFPPRSSLSLKTTRTPLMPSRPAVAAASLRPARRKWRPRTMATWSHTRPRRWWQVNQDFLTRPPLPTFTLWLIAGLSDK